MGETCLDNMMLSSWASNEIHSHLSFYGRPLLWGTQTHKILKCIPSTQFYAIVSANLPESLCKERKEI